MFCSNVVNFAIHAVPSTSLKCIYQENPQVVKLADELVETMRATFNTPLSYRPGILGQSLSLHKYISLIRVRKGPTFRGDTHAQ